MKLVVDKFLLYIRNKHQGILFTMCSFFTVTSNNNQISSFSLIESEEFRETSNIFYDLKCHLSFS